MYTVNCTAVSYSYQIPVADMETILKFEDKNFDIKHLVDRLEAIDGVYNVDYSGHFGAYIFVTIEKDNDSRFTHAKIQNTIAEYISKIKLY